MQTRLPLASVVLAAASLVGASGCHHASSTDPTATGDDPTGTEDQAFAQYGTDANAAESDAQVLVSTLVSSSANGSIGLASASVAGSDLAPATLGDGARLIFLPRGCVSVDSVLAEAKVTYTFDACRFGPNGLLNLSGALVVQYKTDPQHLHLDISSSGFALNGAKLDFTATADVTTSTPNGTDRTMDWSAQLSGTTAGGRDFSWTSHRTVKWTIGEACFALDGDSEGQVVKRDIKTVISNYHRCRASCPDAGGKITITNVDKNRTIEVDYDGTDEATWTGPAGRTVKIQLLCTP
jgi:hypothetical protein